MLILFLLCSYNPTQHSIHMDVVEYNILFTDKAEFVFDQWIFYRLGWNTKTKTYRYDVYDWRLAKLITLPPDWELQQKEFRKKFHEEFPKSKVPSLIPPMTNWPVYYTNDRYHIIFYDLKSLKTRHIITRVLNVTYTMYDPELIERDFLPLNKRILFDK